MTTQQQMVPYSDVMMGVMASQLTGVSIVRLIVRSDGDKKIKVPRQWPFWEESIGDWWIPHHKGPVTREI